MKNFAYNVNTYCENEEFTFRTNSITNALAEFFENVAEGYHTNIINGFTGEVLAIANNPEGEDFATDEMALMMLGHLCAEHWGEEDDEEEDEIPVPVDGGGLGLHDLLEALVAEGTAIKCKTCGLPS